MHQWYEEFVFTITEIRTDHNGGAEITLEESTSGDVITVKCATPEQARINQKFTLTPDEG